MAKRCLQFPSAGSGGGRPAGVAEMVLGLLGNGEGKDGVEFSLLFPFINTYNRTSTACLSSDGVRCAASVMSLGKAKRFQEHDYLESRGLPSSSPGTVLFHNVFIHRLHSLLFWCRIVRTQKGKDGKEMCCSLNIPSKNDQVAEVHESFTTNLTVLILCKSGVNIV